MDIPRLATEEELGDEPIPPDYSDGRNVDTVVSKEEAQGFVEEEARLLVANKSGGSSSPKLPKGAGMDVELEVSHADGVNNAGAEKSGQNDAAHADEPKISRGESDVMFLEGKAPVATCKTASLATIDGEAQSASEGAGGGVGHRRRRRRMTDSSGEKQPLSPVRDDGLRRRSKTEWRGNTVFEREREGYDDKWCTGRVSMGAGGGVPTKGSVGGSAGAGDRDNKWRDDGVSRDGVGLFVDSSMTSDAARTRRRSEVGARGVFYRPRHITGLAEMSPVAVNAVATGGAAAVSDDEAHLSSAAESTGAGDIAGGVAAARERSIRAKEDELVPVYRSRSRSRRIRNRRRSRTWGTAADKDGTETSAGGIWGFTDASFGEDSEGGDGNASASKGKDDGDQDFDPGDGAVVVEDERELGLDNSGGLNGELRMGAEFDGLPSLVTPTVRQKNSSLCYVIRSLVWMGADASSAFGVRSRRKNGVFSPSADLVVPLIREGLF